MDDGVGARREGTAIPYGTYTDGALVLNSCSMDVPMSAVASELGSRTLEAWIALTNVNQRGSGFFGLQMDPAQQDQFDSIVYGEQAPQVWMTGSNNHARTPDHDPTATLESGHDGFNANAFVHIAITYNINGAVAIYRGCRAALDLRSRLGQVRASLPCVFQCALLRVLTMILVPLSSRML